MLLWLTIRRRQFNCDDYHDQYLTIEEQNYDDDDDQYDDQPEQLQSLIELQLHCFSSTHQYDDSGSPGDYLFPSCLWLCW